MGIGMELSTEILEIGILGNGTELSNVLSVKIMEIKLLGIRWMEYGTRQLVCSTRQCYNAIISNFT